MLGVPSESVLAQHGLYDFQLDVPPPITPILQHHFSFDASSSAHTTGTRLAAWARIRPAAGYPTLVRITPGEGVRLYWTPVADGATMTRFRRQAQIRALDSIPISVRSSHPTEGPMNGTHASSSKAAETPAKRYGLDAEMVAWWEDEGGYWLVTREDVLDVEDLVTWWARLFANDLLQDGKAVDFRSVSSDRKGKQPMAPLDMYAEACDMLEKIVLCLQSMQDKKLTLIACRPHTFAVKDSPRRASVIRLTDIAPLPGFSATALLANTKLASSSLFLHDPIDPSYNHLSDAFVRRNLRYLSPGVTSTRRLSNVSCIYSFGVLVYELLTGSTIDGGRASPDEQDVDLLADIHRHVTREIMPPLERLRREKDFGSAGIELPPTQLNDIIMKCLSKDLDERYASLAALAWDLRKLTQICRAKGDLDKFVIGEADRLSRFHLQRKPIYREKELAVLDEAFAAVCAERSSTSSSELGKASSPLLLSRVVNLWGYSGAGKSRIALSWGSEKEEMNNGQSYLLGYSKLDEHIQKPLSSFSQIFSSLLDRLLTDPKEDPKAWGKKIRDTLGSQYTVFLALLPQDIRKLLLLGSQPPPLEAIDWANFVPAFKLWSKRLLQIFATKSRPLILLLDDIHWMPAEEVSIWRAIIDGQQSLDSVLVVSIFRVEEDHSPPSSSLLSASTSNLFVARLPEAGVAALTRACFPAEVDKLDSLASFLYAETQGSPLYVRTLLVTLVREQVIYFDFASLLWRYDALALQSHLSDQNVDAYLRKVQGGLSPEVTELLAMLSCLPVNGIDTELLAQLLDRPKRAVELDITAAASVGTVIQAGRSVKFTHDRQRAAAHHLIPADQLGATHLKVAEFLGQPSLIDDYVFDATDHALAANKLGALVGKEAEFLYLLLSAASRAAISASFVAAKSYLDAANDLIKSNGGMIAWLKRARSSYFDFAEQHSHVCGVLGLHDEAFALLEKLAPNCDTPGERVRVSTLQYRSLNAANRVPEAMKLLHTTLDQNGYNVEHPTAIEAWTPRTPEDIDELEKGLSSEAPDEADVRVQIMTLLAFAGPTIFVVDVDRRAQIFALAVSICRAVGKVHPATVYLLSASSLTTTDRAVKEKVWRLAKRLTIGSSSFLVSGALVCLAAVAHEWVPLEEVSTEMDLAYNATIAHGNYELAAYVVAVDLHARRFSNKPYNVELVKERFDSLRPFLSTPSRVLVITPVAYAANLLEYASPERPPWAMENGLLSAADIEQISGLTMHRALWYTFALRLSILYDAPIEAQQQLVKDGSAFSEALDGIAAGPEWAFLEAIVAIRTGESKPVEAAFTDLKSHTGSPDYALRVEMLNLFIALRDDGLAALEQTETLIERLDAGRYCLFSGLVNHTAGMAIMRVTKNTKLAAGYLRAASAAYRSAECAGLCEMLRTRYGGICPQAPPPRRIVVDVLSGNTPGAVAPPPLRRASVSHGDASSSNISGETSSIKSVEATSYNNENLDTLTLMRSSLALASEQDPPILLCTLLRILCQFARADYAAIALSDDKDKTALRVRAAGAFGRITPYDLSIADDASQTVCPAVIMLHVARTGNAITKVSSIPRMRPDPFYAGKVPRSLICLTISNQGKQSGVILLSSMTTSNNQAQSSSAREVISTLATFATIIISNYSFTRRLKMEVEQRTQELTNALQAKTQFLSQCSHELRSPLSAVLGLAAVLEASPGLTGVQREHLRTIISSGEDLLGLINNILDHSRLESNSVTLERIPFSLREMAEEALDTVAAVAQKKDLEVCLLNSFKTDPPDMLGDPFRIKQVLLNLLANAVKFTPKGRVTVKWHFEITPDDRVAVVLEVEDTGIGIPAQKMNKLFHSFSQIDESITRSFGGSGLGLIISKDLAKLLGGDCTAESEYGKGSKFTFSFIADRGTQEPRKYATFEVPRSCFIICPPDPWWQMLEENLNALGCKPLRFQDDARESVIKDFPEGLNSALNFDYVMIDPSLANKELVEAMIQLQPKAKFIYLVRSLDMHKAMREYDISREAIVARPVKFDSLYEALMPDAVVADLKEADAKAVEPQSTTKSGKYKNRKKVNRDLARTHPLEILLVDDNMVNITVGKRILEMFGYSDIPSAIDGQQAVELAEKKQYDLILLDLQMPVMDGFRAHERIKASPLAGDPCVVALTANADKATEKQCNEAGFFDYLSKPLDIPRLETILGVVFEHRKNHRQLKHNPALE